MSAEEDRTLGAKFLVTLGRGLGDSDKGGDRATRRYEPQRSWRYKESHCSNLRKLESILPRNVLLPQIPESKQSGSWHGCLSREQGV